MTNDLKNFLEESPKNIMYATDVDWTLSIEKDTLTYFKQYQLYNKIRDNNEKIINHVLDLVEKEVKEKYDIDYNMQDEPFRSDNIYNEALDDISIIINNLRV